MAFGLSDHEFGHKRFLQWTIEGFHVDFRVFFAKAQNSESQIISLGFIVFRGYNESGHEKQSNKRLKFYSSIFPKNLILSPILRRSKLTETMF